MTWQIVILAGWFASLITLAGAYGAFLRDRERKRSDGRWWAEHRRRETDRILAEQRDEREASDRR